MQKLKKWTWIDYPELGSTNDEAKKRSAECKGSRFVITAERQTNGRGRRGRSWTGLDGNLFASLGIEVETQYLGQLVFVVSLSLAQTIKNLDKRPEVSLKWPNDVLVNNRKVSGILLEKGEGNYIIVGFGVNIKQAPDIEGLIFPATSLRDAGVEIDRKEFLSEYLSVFNKNFRIWQDHSFDDIKVRWLEMAKSLGEEICVSGEKGDKTGRFIGVDENGMLLLQSGCSIEKIYAGDVFFL